jgi:hypothetical protein
MAIPNDCQECDCIGCENKSVYDHILKDDYEHEFGNFQIQEHYVAGDVDDFTFLVKYLRHNVFILFSYVLYI